MVLELYRFNVWLCLYLVGEKKMTLIINGKTYEAGELIAYVEKLEKENAELKNRNQELLESCEGATMMYKDLQKAKELLKRFIGLENCTLDYDDIKEAEQFLQETDIDNAIQQSNESLDFDKIADEMKQDLKESEVEK